MVTGQQSYVRLLRTRTGGFVEFEYAIDDPGLAVELIMPLAAFEEFCEVNHVQHLGGPDDTVIADDGLGWTLHSATTRRFRNPS